jgi:protease IV
VARRSPLTTIVIVLVLVMAVSGVILASLRPAGGTGAFGGLGGGRIALLEIDGIITDDAGFLRELRRFRRDRSVRGYVVAINSPGGVVGPSQSIYQELRRLRAEDEVPVVAAIGGIGASGGYYIALGADSIFVLPGSITGSIGVIMELPDASELLGRIGVQIQVVKSSEHKDAGSPFRPISPGDQEILQALVLDVYDQFVEVVAEERGLSREAVALVADGRILSGRQALGEGLVDRLGNVNDAIAAAGRMAGLGPEPRVVRPPEPRVTIFDVIFSRAAASAWGRISAPLDEMRMPRVKFMVPM